MVRFVKYRSLTYATSVPVKGCLSSWKCWNHASRVWVACRADLTPSQAHQVELESDMYDRLFPVPAEPHVRDMVSYRQLESPRSGTTFDLIGISEDVGVRCFETFYEHLHRMLASPFGLRVRPLTRSILHSSSLYIPPQSHHLIL